MFLRWGGKLLHCGLLALMVLLSACGSEPEAQSTPPSTPPPSPRVRPDGAELLYAPAPPASAQNPAFSPDGQRVLFTLFHRGYNKGPAGLYLLPLASARPTALLDEAGHDSVNLNGHVWDATSDRIVFASDREDTDEVWTMAANGSNLARITRHAPPALFTEPSFSPEGRWIVFEAHSETHEGQRQGSIWKVRTDGTGLTRLTDGPDSSFDDRQPNWAPSGDRILFQRRSLGSDDWDLYTMATDGSDIRPVMTGWSDDTDGSWSSDGRWIAFSSNYGGLPFPNIFIIPVGGGTPVRVTYNDKHDDAAPAWSSDGKWLAFESHDGRDEQALASLWRVAAPPVATTNPLATVRFWAYQIQAQEEGDNLRKLADSHYDLLTIDQTRSVKGQEKYDSKADVALLKNSANSSGGGKIVISYIDVGEAESYRWYWQPGWRVGNPEWIVAPDPDGWDENYPVKFWREAWKAIVKEYIDRIIEDGYDGIYLDWLEVYSFDPVVKAARAEGLDVRRELFAFVRELAQHARSRKPGFLLVAQNAAELGEFPEYAELFDAIAQEAIWYEGAGDPDSGETPGDMPQDPEDSRQYVDSLKKWQQLGKPVFNVEYARDPSHVQRAYRLGTEHGFKSYVTLRRLNSLTRTPPPGY